MISVDCEMVLCQDGTEAVVRVCAVDHNLEVHFSVPNFIVNHRLITIVDSAPLSFLLDVLSFDVPEPLTEKNTG